MTLRLSMKNIGPFLTSTIQLPLVNNAITHVIDVNSAGKTTTSRVLYCFISGKCQSTVLLRHGARKGEAVLELGERKYALVVEAGKRPVVDVIAEQPYGVYMGLVEGSPLEHVYLNPPRTLDERLVDDILPPAEKREESTVDIETLKKTIKHYQAAIAAKRAELEDVEREIAEVKEKIESHRGINVAPLLEYMSTKRSIDSLRRSLTSVEEKLRKLKRRWDSERFEYVKQKYHEAAAALRQAERNVSAVEKSVAAIQTLVEALNTLADLPEEAMNAIILCGSPVTDQEYLSICISSAQQSLEVLKSVAEKMRGELKALQEKYAKYAKELRELQEAQMEIQRLTHEAERLRKMIEREEAKLSAAETRVREILRSLSASSVEEALRKAEEGGSQLRRLQSRLSSLEARRNQLLSEINALEASLEAARRQLESAQQQPAASSRDEAVRTYREALAEAMYHLQIPDAEPEKLQLLRPGSSYSTSERYMIASAVLYAAVKTIKKMGIEIPFIVMDVPTALDRSRLQRIVKLMARAGPPVILLETGDERKVEVLQ